MTNSRAFLELTWKHFESILHVFSRIGHSIPREIPEKCANVINDFLEYGVVNYKTLNQREDSQ